MWLASFQDPSERNYSVFRGEREFNGNKQGAGFFLTTGAVHRAPLPPSPVSARNSSEKWKTTGQRPCFFLPSALFPLRRHAARITSTSLCMHYSLKMYVNAIENLVSLCVVFPKLPSTRLGKGENEC